MDDRVARLLDRSIGRLRTEVPRSHARVVAALGPTIVSVTVDHETFTVHPSDGDLRISEGRRDDRDVDIVTTLPAVLDVLDGRRSLEAAVEHDLVAVRGPLDDLVRVHDTLLSYVHAAVRARTVDGLLDELRDPAGAAA